LESELAAERESEWIDEAEARECPSCHGSRLNPAARHVRVQGYTIDQFTDLSAGEAARAIAKLRFKGTDQTVAAGLIPEIQQRLRFMETVGLGYLAPGRSAKTLSGGESQRIRLAAQLGSNLRGVLYVLDEPTIRMHPRDNYDCSTPSKRFAKKETRSLSSSMTMKQCGAQITLSILAHARELTAAKWSLPERYETSNTRKTLRPVVV